MLKKFSRLVAIPAMFGIAIVVVGLGFVAPAAPQVFAQVDAQPSVVIPCDGADCDFADFVQLVSNVITFLLLLSLPISVVVFAWAGILMLTARGSEGQVEKAKGLFWNVLWGLVIALSAWLIVKAITTALLEPGTFTNFLG